MFEIQDISNDLFKIGKFTYSKGDYSIEYKNLFGKKDGIQLKNKYTQQYIFDDFTTYNKFTYNSSSFNSVEGLTNTLSNIIVPFTVDINSLATTGSNDFYGNQYISGNLIVTGPIYATSSNAISSSYSLSSSFSSYSPTSLSSSYSISSSYSLNTQKDLTLISGSTNPIVGGRVYYELLKKQSLNTGFVTGLSLSITSGSGNTKFDISPGGFIITDLTDVYNPIPSLIQLTSSLTNITPTYLASANASYIALDINKNVIQSVTPFENTDRRIYCLIGAVIHSNHTTINTTNEIKAPILSPVNQLHDLIKAIGFLNLNGNVYSPANPTVDMSIQKTAGQIWGLGINASNNLDPHRLVIATQATSSFRIRKYDGTETSDKSALVVGDLVTENKDTHVLTTIPSNRYGIFHGSLFQSGLTRLQYPQNIYTTLSDALSNVDKEAYYVEQNILDNSIFRFYLVIQGNTTNFNDPTRFQFVTAGKFGNVLGNTGGAITSAAVITALGYTPQDAAFKRNGSFIISHSGSLLPHTGSIETSLTNNGSGSFTTSSLPTGISSVYNYSTNKLNFTSCSLGDMLDISLDMEVTTTSANQVVSAELVLAEGQPEEYKLTFVGNTQYKDAGLNKIVQYLGLLINTNAVKNNPAKFVFNSSQNATIKVNGYYIKITKY